MKYKRMIYFVSGAACLFLAAGLILYPILGNALAEKNKSLVMTEYSRAVEEMTDTRVAEILAARGDVQRRAVPNIRFRGRRVFFNWLDCSAERI